MQGLNTSPNFKAQKSAKNESKNKKNKPQKQTTSPGGTPLLFDHSGAGG
jgi:hypothetical protein